MAVAVLAGLVSAATADTAGRVVAKALAAGADGMAEQVAGTVAEPAGAVGSPSEVAVVAGTPVASSLLVVDTPMVVGSKATVVSEVAAERRLGNLVVLLAYHRAA